MFRLAVPLLAASAVLAAPVPEIGKAAKEREAVLAELGLPDKGQKLPAVPPAYLPEAAPDDADRVALRAACRVVADALKAVRETSALPDTFAVAGGLDKVKRRLRAVQVEVARRTVDLTDAADDLQAMVEKVGERETSKRWQANARLLLAFARQELAALHEYNLALGNIITETVELPAVTAEVNAMKLEAVPKMRSNRGIRDLAVQAAADLDAVARRHTGTPWATLAATAAERNLGLNWVPTKTGK